MKPQVGSIVVLPIHLSLVLLLCKALINHTIGDVEFSQVSF